MIYFDVEGGREGAIRFMDSLKLAQIVTHVADARTCVLHPASHTHRQMNDEQLREAGVSPGLIRFSVGIENPQDIIDDLEQALKAKRKKCMIGTGAMSDPYMPLEEKLCLTRGALERICRYGFGAAIQTASPPLYFRKDAARRDRNW